MAVKDLINLYESPPISNARNRGRATSTEPSSSTTATLLPTPARFIHHPRTTMVHDDPLMGTGSTVPNSSGDGMKVEDTEELKQVREEDVTIATTVLSPKDRPTAIRHSTIQFTNVEESQRLIQHTYPPQLRNPKYPDRPRLYSVTTSTSNGTFSSTLSHVPVPITTVFSRNAAPLHLPKLDEYLSSLPPPEFLEGESKGKETTSSTHKKGVNPTQDGFAGQPTIPGMFPPMDRLKTLGLSLDDLEVNSVQPPFWKDRKSILWTLFNLVIGFLVRHLVVTKHIMPLIIGRQGSSALASFYSLQGLVNTVQVFALILSTIGMSHCCFERQN